MNKISIEFLYAFYGLIGFSKGFVCDEHANHCYTSIDIRLAYTMTSSKFGQVYAKDRQLYSQNNDPVPVDDIVSADGWNITRKLITANGTMPGPPIFLYQNQTITIVVNNRLVDEAVTIHWHGIDQLEHPAMDGVAYVSQCPILPDKSFNYTFKPRFGGSYWYHSHLGIQRDMGLYGAFIVLRKSDHFQKPPLNQHIIQIQEWNHEYDAVDLLTISPLPQPHSILINGRGEFQDILAPIETFTVRKGDQYLFRLIGVGSHSTLLFTIPGLKLNVTETDGFEVVPTIVDEIIIYPAERYDFEIDLNYAEERIYNITISVLSSPNLTVGKNIGLGFLNVTTGDNIPLQVYTANDNNLRVLNCPFEIYPKRENIICIPVSNLNCTTCVHDNAFSDDHIINTHETSTLFLNFGFPNGSSSINGRIYRSPTVAPLTQPSETDTNCDACHDENTCECSYSIPLKSGSEVIMVMMTLGQGATISHPVHMHGHTFEVLKMVFPNVTNDGEFVFTEDIICSERLNNSESQCNNATWTNESWNDFKNIPGINLNNPIRKDTVVVPYGGYVIIRIETSNPGVWFFHCHIDKHMVEGMAVMLNESFQHQKGYIPDGLPSCNSLLKTQSGGIQNVSKLTSPEDRCSIPADLQNSTWSYLFTDKSDRHYHSYLIFGRTTLQYIEIYYTGEQAFLFDPVKLYNWTCIYSSTRLDTDMIVVFRKDKRYTHYKNKQKQWLYLCFDFMKISRKYFDFKLVSDYIYLEEELAERIYMSESGNEPVNVTCQDDMVGLRHYRHLSRYTPKIPDAPCTLPKDLTNKDWEYGYTQVSDNSSQSKKLIFGTTTLYTSDIMFEANGTKLDNWTCIQSLPISNIGAVVVFRSDSTFTRPNGGNSSAYLCMQLTKVTNDFYYFYLLSDISTDVTPNERVFVSEEGQTPANDAPLCSTFCQYTDSPKIRTLRRQGSVNLPDRTPLCPCASSCSESHNSDKFGILIIVGGIGLLVAVVIIVIAYYVYQCRKGKTASAENGETEMTTKPQQKTDGELFSNKFNTGDQ